MILVLRVSAISFGVNNELANIYMNKVNRGISWKKKILKGISFIFIGELISIKYVFKISQMSVLHWSICRHSCFSIKNIEFVFCKVIRFTSCYVVSMFVDIFYWSSKHDDVFPLLGGSQHIPTNAVPSLYLYHTSLFMFSTFLCNFTHSS